MESRFVIISSDNCPIYQPGDEFKLVDRELRLSGKSACLTLMDDMMQAVKYIEKLKNTPTGKTANELFNCSGEFTGCQGFVRLQYCRDKAYLKASLKLIEEELTAIVGKLGNFSIFKSLNEDEIREIISHFRIEGHSKGDVILKRGEPGVKLYIILSGEVEVVGDYDIALATLGKGEAFGEMSLISGNPVNLTVKVTKTAKIISMNGNHFRMMFDRFPTVQRYFAQLLVDRLEKSNIEKIHYGSKDIVGSLGEISPAELFQTLNMAQKTGKLNLYLRDGAAVILFKDGEVIWAEYNGKTPVDAFYETIRQMHGNFRFEPSIPKEQQSAPVLGDFMRLLMEGLNRAEKGRSYITSRS